MRDKKVSDIICFNTFTNYEIPEHLTISNIHLKKNRFHCFIIELFVTVVLMMPSSNNITEK